MKELLLQLHACREAREWADNKTWPEIFETCHRGDWLLWLFKKVNPNSLKELTRAKAHCALTVRHLMKDQNSINACEVALKFADDQATHEELNAAAAADAADYAAYAAAYAAAAAYADDDDARIKNEKETADICRKYLPIEIWNIK